MFVKVKFPGTFRRSVRDEAGRALRVLQFDHESATELTDAADIAAIQNDLEKALVECDARGKPQWRAMPLSDAEPPHDPRESGKIPEARNSETHTAADSAGDDSASDEGADDDAAEPSVPSGTDTVAGSSPRRGRRAQLTG